MTPGTVLGRTLDVGPNWHFMSPAQRKLVCNGVGPASWPKAVIDILNQLPCLKPAAMVHDVDFEVGGSEQDRLDANERFRENGYRCAKHRYGSIWRRLFTKKGRKEWLLAIALVELAYAGLVAGSHRYWRGDD